MRLLFGLLSMTAMRFELSVEPLFCHHDMHYFRAYSKIHVGNSHSRENEEKIGYILHCFKCGYRTVVSHQEMFSSARKQDVELQIPRNCPTCASNLRVGGPLWIGNIQSSDFVEAVQKFQNYRFSSGSLTFPPIMT